MFATLTIMIGFMSVLVVLLTAILCADYVLIGLTTTEMTTTMTRRKTTITSFLTTREHMQPCWNSRGQHGRWIWRENGYNYIGKPLLEQAGKLNWKFVSTPTNQFMNVTMWD